MAWREKGWMYLDSPIYSVRGVWRLVGRYICKARNETKRKKPVPCEACEKKNPPEN